MNASGGGQDPVSTFSSAISTGSSFTRPVPEMWFRSATLFPHPLLPLPGGLRGCPKAAPGGLPRRSTGVPAGWGGGSHPRGRRGAPSITVPPPQRLGCPSRQQPGCSGML